MNNISTLTRHLPPSVYIYPEEACCTHRVDVTLIETFSIKDRATFGIHSHVQITDPLEVA